MRVTFSMTLSLAMIDGSESVWKDHNSGYASEASCYPYTE